MKHRVSVAAFVSLLVAIQACESDPTRSDRPRPAATSEEMMTAAFLAIDGVYNSELMAPFDIFHHTLFRDSLAHIVPFIVSPNGGSVVTFEGLEIGAHYSFDDAPPIDILVIPSAEGSMSWDLDDDHLLDWIRRTTLEATYVLTLCDGVFPLAATGLLEGRTVTTFPADRDDLQSMFPHLTVRYDANFVVDGKYITSVGGALSYEPALYLLETEYSKQNADLTAEGLVIDWNLSAVPHAVISQ